jgi:hypothetical protein
LDNFSFQHVAASSQDGGIHPKATANMRVWHFDLIT